MSRLLGQAGRRIGSHTYVRLRKLTTRSVPLPGFPAGAAGARLPPPLRQRQPGGLAVLAGYGRLTGPLALMTWWKATGGLLCVHLPPERAPIPSAVNWYLPLPLIPAYLPVPLSSL